MVKLESSDFYRYFGELKMDAYRFVLTKLYEAAGGRDTKPVDFRELLKQIGYYSSYADIFERLSREGWIAEDEKRPHHVRITHWGISEAKKMLSGAAESNLATLKKNVNQAVATAKEIVVLLESFDNSKDALIEIERKLTEINNLIAKIKSNI
ncbi:MAG: hypothetical protein N2Z23_03880 [Pyrinomonadaceae bacterium]|nr:hypothetical protein [Pyrinomonadaceae bacterium]MCX7639567.1 hypothetical protein [Pyrinomonadaceae bacterium]MDW8303960.1 hypothetical protein [Acidobacteriota bacterium]